MQSAPSSRPSSPESDDEDPTATRIIKISFRKGGDKAFYAVLKRSLKGKMWEVRPYSLSSRLQLIDKFGTQANGIGGTSPRVSDPGAGFDRSTVGKSGISAWYLYSRSTWKGSDSCALKLVFSGRWRPLRRDGRPECSTRSRISRP